MLTTAALILIVTIKVVLGQDDRKYFGGDIIQLDMAVNSVDDRYDGCREKMENLVTTKYLKQEICADLSDFGAAWINSTGKISESKTLKMHHLSAITVYTGLRVNRAFNDDVRTGRQKYKEKKYTWYSLHFLLTEAIQILKKKQNKCKKTYRGTKLMYNETVQDKEIRFGSFASSSLELKIAKRFGNESCFEIETCYGADVSKYSSLTYEKEVLIPPYETFKVTEIKKKGAWCNTVFVLKSFGIKSNLNCAGASVEPKRYHNVIISD
ncbi:erythroblast NAD(P)(+)--arginine ADP-ribosyltransferase-like [Misgurnus anguillicaudatus]|uniref:erythroblast NAD(P)(+)--arginine ADP-ribosyltransferase-like n=1 Tax=Misgurnus anguillicaudatus TaxID=75329 RepID=UPI003CCF8AC6